MAATLLQTEQWYDIAPFKALLTEEQAFWQQIVADYAGTTMAVQVGGVAGFAEPICPEGTQLISIAGHADADIQASVAGLPLRPNSCDLLLLPHTLDGTLQPEACINDIAMALAPNGVVVLSVLNRQSWYGLCRRYQKPLRRMPNRRYFLALKVVQWLSRAGLAVEMQSGIGFRPPIASQGVLQSLRFLDVLGKVAWPQWSNSIILVARKKVEGMTPVKEKAWNKQYALSSIGFKR